MTKSIDSIQLKKILDEVLDSRFAEADKNLEKKLEQKFEEKLKPIHKKLNKLQSDMDLIARSADRDITNTMHRVDKIEKHLGLPNTFSI